MTELRAGSSIFIIFFNNFLRSSRVITEKREVKLSQHGGVRDGGVVRTFSFVYVFADV